uniref:Uncharacterized protein n=1 Tax=Megaselia scalaris TaxID=36166 RepID=T1GC62_MEGSC
MILPYNLSPLTDIFNRCITEGGGTSRKLAEKNKKKKKEERKKSPEQLAKERARFEVEKVSLVRAKMAKLKKRPGKLGAVGDFPKRGASNIEAPKKKFGGSKFSVDLTDVSRNGALRLRSEANRHQKLSKKGGNKKVSSVKMDNKAGKNKFNKGKNFGGPRFQKKSGGAGSGGGKKGGRK